LNAEYVVCCASLPGIVSYITFKMEMMNLAEFLC